MTDQPTIPCTVCGKSVLPYVANDGTRNQYCETCKVVFSKDLSERRDPSCVDCRFYKVVARQKFIQKDGTVFYGEGRYCTNERLISVLVKVGGYYPADGKMLVGRVFPSCRGAYYFDLVQPIVRHEPEPARKQYPDETVKGNVKKRGLAKSQAKLF